MAVPFCPLFVRKWQKEFLRKRLMSCVRWSREQEKNKKGSAAMQHFPSFFVPTKVQKWQKARSHTSKIFFLSQLFLLLPRHPIMHSISREEMRQEKCDKKHKKQEL